MAFLIVSNQTRKQGNRHSFSWGLSCHRGIMRYEFRVILLVILFLSVSCNDQVTKLNTDLANETENLEKQAGKHQKLDHTVKNDQNHIPGEVLIKFKEGTSEESIKAIQNKLNLKIISVVPKIYIYRMKIQNNSSVEEVIKKLQGFKEVEYSEPNYVLDFQ